MKCGVTLLAAALTTALAACSPPARSTAYFDAHPNEIDGVLTACATVGRREAECAAAGLAQVHQKADARMSLYREKF